MELLPEYDEDNPPPLPPRKQRVKRRRSPRKHKRARRIDSDDESSAEDKSSADELPVHVAKKRREVVDNGELHTYELRASVREGRTRYINVNIRLG